MPDDAGHYCCLEFVNLATLESTTEDEIQQLSGHVQSCGICKLRFQETLLASSGNMGVKLGTLVKRMRAYEG